MLPFVLLLIAAPAADAWIAPGPAGQVVSPPASTKPASDLVSQRLTALELALSATVVQPPEAWRFDRLRGEAQSLAASATREADRAAAREISQRIERFAAIAGRSAQVGQAAPPSRSATGAPPAVRLAPPVQLTKAPARPAAPAHDAIGILRPVVSKRPGTPKYAVVDEQGRLAALVTPTPEVEDQFRRLLGQRVGLDGRRGYLTGLRREHLTAERVTALRR